jgi:hypothetical protein
MPCVLRWIYFYTTDLASSYAESRLLDCSGGSNGFEVSRRGGSAGLRIVSQNSGVENCRWTSDASLEYLIGQWQMLTVVIEYGWQLKFYLNGVMKGQSVCSAPQEATFRDTCRIARAQDDSMRTNSC